MYITPSSNEKNFNFTSQYNIFERLPAGCGVHMLSSVTDEIIILRRLTSQLFNQLFDFLRFSFINFWKAKLGSKYVKYLR